MPNVRRFTFRKSERLSSKIQVDRLFGGGSKSMVAFPLRIVYRLEDAERQNVSVLISVSKKHFHHAVDRNRVKRQIREAYRLNKQMLWDSFQGTPKALFLALIWLDDKLYTSEEVDKRVINLLKRVSEKLPLMIQEHLSEDEKQI